MPEQSQELYGSKKLVSVRRLSETESALAAETALIYKYHLCKVLASYNRCIKAFSVI